MAELTDDEVIAAAREQGFELGWRFVDGKPCAGFTRGDDDRYPAYADEAMAIRYMRDWLRRGRTFE